MTKEEFKKTVGMLLAKYEWLAKSEAMPFNLEIKDHDPTLYKMLVDQELSMHEHDRRIAAYLKDKLEGR